MQNLSLTYAPSLRLRSRARARYGNWGTEVLSPLYLPFAQTRERAPARGPDRRHEDERGDVARHAHGARCVRQRVESVSVCVLCVCVSARV